MQELIQVKGSQKHIQYVTHILSYDASRPILLISWPHMMAFVIAPISDISKWFMDDTSPQSIFENTIYQKIAALSEL